MTADDLRDIRDRLREWRTTPADHRAGDFLNDEVVAAALDALLSVELARLDRDVQS